MNIKNFNTAMLILLFLFFLKSPLLSHHAMEFIELESYNTASKGEVVFHLHFDYMVDDKNNPDLDHWEYTPGFSYGITNRLMFDVHTHFAKFNNGHIIEPYKTKFNPSGPSPFMEAVAFSLQYRITTDFPIDIAVSALCELPYNNGKEFLGSERVYEAVLIFSKTFTNHINITSNFIFGREGNENFSAWGIGIKVPLTSQSHGISAGIELLGDFSGDYSVLTGVYIPLGSENIILKTGIEIGKGSEHKRLNTTLMFRF